MLIDQKVNFNIRKNNLDNLFLNLTENPIGLENKGLRSVLSMIYELIEEEYGQTFISVNSVLRNTEFYFFKENNEFYVFITPKTNFQFYLKSKGSMYNLKSEYKDLPEIGLKEGYIVPIDIIWDYFCGFENYINYDYLSQSYKMISMITYFGNKLIEKLHFLPKVKKSELFFSIKYEIYDEIAEINNIIEEIKNENCEKYLNKVNIKDLLNNYVNYQIYRFLNIKSQKFNSYKNAFYFIKPQDKKISTRSIDIPKSLDSWLDEIYIGKYNILPEIKICENKNEKFNLQILVYNKDTDESIYLNELSNIDEKWGHRTSHIKNLIEKQLNYIIKQIPNLKDYIYDENKYLSLNEVYNIITQSTYYLTKANINLILPNQFNNIIIPRISINAKVKDKREEDLEKFLNTSKSGTIKLGEILNFTTDVTIGNEKINLSDFEKLTSNKSGLIKYKEYYVLIDSDQSSELISKIKNIDLKNKEITSLELLCSSYTGQLENFEFNYDEAFMRVVNNINNKETQIEVPKNLNGELRPYQVKGYKWLYTNAIKGFGSCIADDMGLGKTIQVISLILKLFEAKKLKSQVLIVCPTTLIGNWAKEFSTFAPDIKTSIYHGSNREFDNGVNVILTTYAILRIDNDEFKKRKWSLFIIDEAQNIKNPDTSQTLAVKSIKADYKVAMTGTPVENRLIELWSIFDFINKGYLGSIRDFQKSYAVPIEKFKETKRAQKLKLCVSPFVLRRLKTDKTIIDDLPQKIVIDDYCYLTKSQTVLYEKVLTNIMGEISKLNGINRRGMIFKLITSLKQVCNHPHHYLKTGNINYEASGKAAKTIDLITNILENNEKAIIFTQYKEMGKILKDIIKNELQIDPMFFHGSLNRLEREEMINGFQNKDENKLMILSLKAGGTGLNLTSATNVIHYDLWWNPAVEQQATDRTYRIGQDKNVMVHRLITLGTFEEKIDEIIKQKQQLVNIAVYEGEKIITELSDKEIMEIFSLSA